MELQVLVDRRDEPDASLLGGVLREVLNVEVPGICRCSAIEPTTVSSEEPF
jgi:hypothetical protein